MTIKVNGQNWRFRRESDNFLAWSKNMLVWAEWLVFLRTGVCLLRFMAHNTEQVLRVLFHNPAIGFEMIACFKLLRISKFQIACV